MIVEFLIILAKIIFNTLMKIFGILPSMPDAVINVVDKIFEILQMGIGIASIFVDFNFIKILIPIYIAIINFDRIAKLVMWIVRKIPFFSIK